MTEETKYYDQHGNTYTQSSMFSGFINAFYNRINELESQLDPTHTPED